MGAWGEKAFQNDSALDWLAELEKSGVAGLRVMLTRIADTDEPIDVDDGSAAIAAAEIVAAALGGGTDRLPPEASLWLTRNPGALHQDDGALARDAAERVLAEDSELAMLWAENGADNPWLEHVRELLSRLDARAGRAQPRPRAAAQKKSPAKVGERKKQMILAFLGGRDLTPTAAQLLRINQSQDLAEIRRWLARVSNAPSVAVMLDG